MTQVSSLANANSRPLFKASTAAVTCPASGNTVLLEMNLLGAIEHLCVAITVAVHAIDGFLVECKFHESDIFHTLTDAVTATPAGLVLAASGTLASQTVGTGWFILDTRGVYAVRISASGSVDDTTTVAAVATGS